jgi:hypothetical protein
VQQDRDIISAFLKINSINSFNTILNTELNILAFYTTTCFRLTVTTDFALLYFWLNGSVDILVTAFKYILCSNHLRMATDQGRNM